MSTGIYSHKAMRRQLWCDVVVAVASSSNANDVNVMINWADQAVKAFDERYPSDVSNGEMHASYMRIREMLGAWNTIPGGADRFEITESAIQLLKDRNTVLESALQWANENMGKCTKPNPVTEALTYKQTNPCVCGFCDGTDCH